MAGLIGQLIDVLQNQVENVSALIELSEKKRAAVIGNNTGELQNITSCENMTVGRLQKLDRSRESVMAEIGIVLNIEDKNYTLSRLCELIRVQQEYEVLSGLTQKLRDGLAELKALNTQNRTLLEHSLDYIDFSVNAIHSAIEPGGTFYDTSGDEIGPGRVFFDAKQ